MLVDCEGALNCDSIVAETNVFFLPPESFKCICCLLLLWWMLADTCRTQTFTRTSLPVRSGAWRSGSGRSPFTGSSCAHSSSTCWSAASATLKTSRSVSVRPLPTSLLFVLFLSLLHLSCLYFPHLTLSVFSKAVKPSLMVVPYTYGYLKVNMTLYWFSLVYNNCFWFYVFYILLKCHLHHFANVIKKARAGKKIY